MANVIQSIPDRCTCATQVHDCANDDSQCIFLDKGRFFMRETGSGFGCRRHPKWELAVRHEKDEFEIYKCPPCMRETQKGE